jgi:hypothetical protein
MRGARVPVPVARVLAWFAGAGLAVIAAANGPPAFVAGDLIVKFTDASESGAFMARAVQGEAAAQRQLPDLARRLSAGLGVSVIAARVTSGRELVLGIDREQLLAKLAQRVQHDPAVKSVQPRAEPKTVLPPAEIALVVEFTPGGEVHALLQRVARAGERTSREIDVMVARLAAGTDPQPVGHVDGRGQLILTLDIAALTVQLVERLKRRADVEYAQVSQVMRPIGPVGK